MIVYYLAFASHLTVSLLKKETWNPFLETVNHMTGFPIANCDDAYLPTAYMSQYLINCKSSPLSPYSINCKPSARFFL